MHLRVKFSIEFARFKALSRALFKHATDDSSNLLSPMLHRAMQHMQPLSHYGILGKHPMLPFALCTSREMAWLLHTALCSFGGPLKQKSPPIRLSVQDFKPPKFAPWDSLIFSDRPLQQHAEKDFRTGPD